MPPVTQKTPDQAAALIQARVRGYQHRDRQQRVIRGVTALQARQRGRYTRREYRQLLEFYNEQESFLQQTKQRQLRIWQHEQELYFLQHTTADQLEEIRAFQFRRGARRIQREWRRSHPPKIEPVDVSGLGRPFDPFGFIEGEDATHADAVNVDDTSASRLLKELYGKLPRSAADLEAPQGQDVMARKRTELQERIKQVKREQEKKAALGQQRPSKPTRRELYDQVLSHRTEMAQKLRSFSDEYRSKRSERDMETARIRSSCKNRLEYLLDETRVSTLLGNGTKRAPAVRIEQERRRFEEMTADWSLERKQSAWSHHVQVLNSVLGKEHWYDTFIAGEQRDIRRVYANSPWDHEKKVWQWPMPTSTSSDEPTPHPAADAAEVTPLDKFIFSLNVESDENVETNNQDESGEVVAKPPPVSDRNASTWWRAHSTQSHFGYKQQRQIRSFTPHREQGHSNQDAHVTPEMLANPVFYDLYQRSVDKARLAEMKSGVKARLTLIEKQITQKVIEVETKIELNTRCIVEQAAQLQRQKLRKSKEESAATQIQRQIRGKLGRKRAGEHRAQYFVMVRGRAIRKGKCEECGDQQAVLECKECEESLHFCPVCWVQVHSTRRRKTHIPIPMAIQLRDTAPIEESGTVQSRTHVSVKTELATADEHWSKQSETHSNQRKPLQKSPPLPKAANARSTMGLVLINPNRGENTDSSAAGEEIVEQKRPRPDDRVLHSGAPDSSFVPLPCHQAAQRTSDAVRKLDPAKKQTLGGSDDAVRHELEPAQSTKVEKNVSRFRESQLGESTADRSVDTAPDAVAVAAARTSAEGTQQSSLPEPKSDSKSEKEVAIRASTAPAKAARPSLRERMSTSKPAPSSKRNPPATHEVPQIVTDSSQDPALLDAHQTSLESIGTKQHEPSLVVNDIPQVPSPIQKDLKQDSPIEAPVSRALESETSQVQPNTSAQAKSPMDQDTAARKIQAIRHRYRRQQAKPVGTTIATKAD